MADLSTLSPAEREVLLLLADGHTAKSAAVRLDISVNTVNERLRSARAKAGVSSSRELGRLVRESLPAQEVWPKEIGVAPRKDAMPSIPPGPFPTFGLGARRGVIVMIAIVGAIAAWTIYALSNPSGSESPSAAPPRVVSTYPTANAEVVAGKLALRVTFDRPMRSGSYSFIATSPDTFPHCPGAPTQSSDGRTFTLDCTVEAHRTYEIGFNNLRFQNFVAADGGAPATPAVLRFTTP